MARTMVAMAVAAGLAVAAAAAVAAIAARQMGGLTVARAGVDAVGSMAEAARVIAVAAVTVIAAAWRPRV